MITGGDSGGFLGPKEIISLITGYLGLSLEIFQETTPAAAMKDLLRGMAKAVGGIGAALSAVFTAVELILECGGFGSLQFNILMTVYLATSITMLAVTISTGLAGVALTSLLNSMVSVILDKVLRILKTDAGCNS